ncbi:DUF58 domain-containing protein [Haloplanus rallus]|jgi:uncharacterized protein (DUF58 family)|uniref:DUF58 domain-containing protein n=1 Tax=Haloplanus rallus TaxID=1816183 RepID=A0A6B9F7J8_9EURY|nr:DUF58 domain-containing protein [Haloplanus rallus]QGX96535.1 DUF58 domain-containing protein [Haloplanus rallus]
MPIEPDFLDELDRFEASLNQQSTAVKKGEQESPSVGEGLTFSDYRRYSPGDDTRLIDWRLYARTEEFFIKQFEEERNLTVHVLLDASASMDFGEGDQHKFEFGAKLGLGYAYLTAEEHNDFRFSLFRDRAERIDTGTATRGEVLALVDRINETDPDGDTDFEAALGEYAAGIRSRSLVVVVTDCIGDLDGLETGIASLARNEVVLVQVLSPDELDPEVAGDTIFEDLESDLTRRTYFGGRLAERYRTRVDEFVDDVSGRAQDLGVTHELVGTDEDFFDAFSSVWIG